MRFNELVNKTTPPSPALSYTESLEVKLKAHLAEKPAPKFTALEWACMEGGNSLDEGWRDVAAAGALATGLAVGGFGAMQKLNPTPQTIAAPIAAPDAAEEPVTLSNNPSAEIKLQKAAIKAGINGTELAQFLAQTRHESADFSRMTEFGNTKYFNKMYDPVYKPRKAKILGNTQAGDGVKFRGRGFIQITGRENYRRAGEALNLPLEERPELAEKPDVAIKIAIWYWKSRVTPYIKNFADTPSVTRKINPGLRGIEQRKEYFTDYQENI
jgi:predicted chitinase